MPETRVVAKGLDTIVVAIDLSLASRVAVERAADLASAHGSRLYVVHVVPETSLALPGVAIEERALTELFELAESRALPGSTVVECVRLGRPAREIAAFAREKKAGLIVTGTHARTGIASLVSSSIAAEIVRRAGCPVLIVREAAGPGSPHPKRVLAATDYGPASRDAARAAVALMAADGEIDVVHVIPDDVARSAARLAVVDPVDAREAMVAVARTNLERWIQESLPLPRPRTRALVCVGDATVLLGDLAVGGGYDLVACGTHGREGLRRALLGSVAEAIVHAAFAPVLVVREDGT